MNRISHSGSRLLVSVRQVWKTPGNFFLRMRPEKKRKLQTETAYRWKRSEQARLVGADRKATVTQIATTTQNCSITIVVQQHLREHNMKWMVHSRQIRNLRLQWTQTHQRLGDESGSICTHRLFPWLASAPSLRTNHAFKQRIRSVNAEQLTNLPEWGEAVVSTWSRSQRYVSNILWRNHAAKTRGIRSSVYDLNKCVKCVISLVAVPEEDEESSQTCTIKWL